MRGIQIYPKEKEIGLRVKCFSGNDLDEAYELKKEWLSQHKNIIVVKVKPSVVRGKGRVTGNWVSSKIYVSFIKTNKFEELKEHRRNKSKNKKI